MQRTRTFVGAILCAAILVSTVPSATAAGADSWSGEISFTASPTVVNYPNRSTELRIVLSEPVVYSGLSMSIYDDTGRRVASCTYQTHQCTRTEVIPLAESRTFIAYVAEGAPLEGPPPGVRAQASVEVTHSGWPGEIRSFTTTASILPPGVSVARLRVELTHPTEGTPYSLSIYDDEQNLVAHCTSRTSLACEKGVSASTGRLRYFRAYLGRGAPSTGPPSEIIQVAGPVVVARISEDDLIESAPVAALAAGLVAKYGELEACLRLGEATRTHAARSSVPDVTLVCNSGGVTKALRYLSRTRDGLRVISALEVLIEADSGPEPPSYNPDCDHLSFDGTCLDVGTPTENRPEPEPQPEPGGGWAGIPPPPNCLDSVARNLLEESMPDQYHHLASIYGSWGDEFHAIAYQYGLSTADTNRLWNVVRMPHRGPHPREYHDWVYANMERADSIAQGDVDTFLDLFARWVRDVVVQDPTIVRVAYWKCYR